MSILSDGLSDWFRRNRGHVDERQSAAHSTTGGQGDQEPVVVWRAANQMEAQVVKGRLESEGIPAIIQGEALGAIYGLTSGSLAETLVLVPAPLAEKAEMILYADETEVLADDDAGEDTANSESLH
ncbi:MAG: DUF2007 domain-containing protein [Caldilineaceae bacterium]|nr:DUF2007 domain-containing protein [Caldilineaceae bacterium]MCB0123562.1 DUF2007 domain-containing protein [Caldilineaceae bacterium]